MRFTQRLRTVFGAAIAAVIAAAGVLVGQSVQTPEARFGAAQHFAEIEGNLEAAITAYKAVLADKTAGRALTARTLLALGAAYERVGNATEARAAYRQLVNDFAGSPEAAEARGRLDSNSSAPSQRRIWGGSPPDGAPVDDTGTPSPDGRWLSFTDWRTGDLAVRDLESGRERLVNPQPTRYARGYADESMFSPDGRQIVYTFVSPTSVDLRIVAADGANDRVVFANPEIQYVKTVGWSPDGLELVVSISTKGRAIKLSRIAVDTGKEIVLKTLPWASLGRACLSPDGRSIAYDIRTAEQTAIRAVMLLAIDGSREVTLSAQGPGDTVIGWSPTGDRVLFTRQQPAGVGIYALPAASPAPGREPTLLHTEGALRRALGFTRRGALLYSKSHSTSEVYRTTWNSGRPGDGAKPVGQLAPGLKLSPAWSRDGALLVYKTGGAGFNQPLSLVVVSIASGQERQVPVPDLVQSGNGTSVSADGTSILVVGVDQKGRRGAFSIDLATGAATLVAADAPKELIFGPSWLPSGGALFFRRIDDGTRANEIVMLDRRSARERYVSPGAGLERAFIGAHVSPDGKLLALRTGGAPAEPTVRVGPVEGPFRELARGDDVGIVGWTPDSTEILVRTSKTDPGGRTTHQLWRLPVNGSQRTEVIGIDPAAQTVAISPDGRDVAYEVRSLRNELWKLEGLLSGGAK